MTSEQKLIELIRRLGKSPRSPYGIGDDAAIWKARKNSLQVVTTDFLVEGVDFKKNEDAALVGRKALGINLSDIAAMGARPVSALLYLALPPNIKLSTVKKMIRGFRGLAKSYGVSLIGGDLSRSRQMMIGAVLIGEKKEERNFLRSGAKPGDSIWVTGELGGSLLGKHLRFQPRVKEALFLAKHFKIHAAIDLSDGLGKDLPEVLNSSKRGAEINLDRIPISRSAWRLPTGQAGITHGNYRKALEHVFTDGEDFELLFTCDPKDDPKLLKLWSKTFSTRLTKIGTVTHSKGIECVSKGKKMILSPKLWSGYDHFGRESLKRDRP